MRYVYTYIYIYIHIYRKYFSRKYIYIYICCSNARKMFSLHTQNMICSNTRYLSFVRHSSQQQHSEWRGTRAAEACCESEDCITKDIFRVFEAHVSGCSNNVLWVFEMLLSYVIICIYIYIYIYIYEIHIYICTRILGPPKAGNKNRQKTLIILKSKCLKNMDL